MKEQVKEIIKEYQGRILKMYNDKLECVNDGNWSNIIKLEARIDELEEVVKDLEELIK